MATRESGRRVRSGRTSYTGRPSIVDESKRCAAIRDAILDGADIRDYTSYELEDVLRHCELEDLGGNLVPQRR
jgi:hypothetical protein